MAEKFFENRTVRGMAVGAVGMAAIVASCDGPDKSSHEKITEIIECDEEVSFTLTDDKALKVLGFADERSNGQKGYADILVSRIDGGIYAGVESLGRIPIRAVDRSDPDNFAMSAESTRWITIAPEDGAYEATPRMPVLGGDKDKDIQANFAIKGDEEKQKVAIEIDCDRER